VKLPPIKRKPLPPDDVSSVLLAGRLSVEINEIDWKIFKQERYMDILTRRAGLLDKINKELRKILHK
jgi:hypothetical protein